MSEKDLNWQTDVTVATDTTYEPPTVEPIGSIEELTRGAATKGDADLGVVAVNYTSMSG